MRIEWSGLIEFNENNVNRFVPNKGGVYRLSVGMTDGRRIIFYVGKAEDLQKRLLEHLSENEQNSCIKDKVQNKKTFFKFALVSSEEDRKNIENTMYHRIKGLDCNKEEPEGKIIDVNLDLG